MSNTEVIINIFPLLSTMVSHYQYLGIVMISATSILLIWSIKNKYNATTTLLIITEILLIIYLIFGLFVYAEMVTQLQILSESGGITRLNLHSLYNNYIVCQSWLGFAALVFLIISFISFSLNLWGNR